VAERAPELVNDPTQSTWEAVVDVKRRFVEVELVPRALVDPRFAYRVADVPAASHPTIAAALVRVAGIDPRDVVWDPFVGSGLELIERARAGAFARLVGSDSDPKALDAAGANLRSAGIRADLELGDALTLTPRGVSLVVTNPPMGRRVARHAGLAPMLDAFVAHAAKVLAPGGRLVWIAPSPKRARAAGERAGLSLTRAHVIDMGGFEGELQRWEKPGPTRKAARHPSDARRM
jgi:23S rRNA G2445 N2-methylase RlmL